MVTLAKDTAVSLSVGVIAGALLVATLTKKKSAPPIRGDQNYFTDQTELEVMSYVETYQEATRVEIL
jgi:hypothetical protein